ncbi:malonyl-CoA/methylmalonyl-CoA synthetase [Rhodovulum sp. ES.010]|uniref:malonate--CoA ligase n=1 Tax=Rhodovulum sp. ES.010 TaxID=1882821 RepID=UPI00092B6898|nr:malonyl-CoA synthase [Rhodovulum sp. ES.010]SIO02331.1 malonyl-CoA/methylmalonyl-CoA synthetase [Rhodovulum sp. ES.010]
MANPLYDRLFAPHEGKSSTFLHLPDGGVLTHDAFLRRAAQFAHAIHAMGLVHGDRLAMQVEKSPEALMLIAACIQAGVIFVPLNTAYTPAELAYFLENSGAGMFVADGTRAEALRPVAGAAGSRLETLNADGTGSLPAAASGMPEAYDAEPRTEDNIAAFLYTSGTTGRSKGAMLTERNLISNAEALAAAWRFSADDVLLHALPIFHSHGLFVATNVTLVAGGAMILLPKFDVDSVTAALPRATAMMGVPTFYTRLLEDPRFTRDLVAHMRLFVSGSAPLLAETHRAFEDRTGHRILERYGMTETNMNTSNPYDGPRIAGTVGTALPGVEVKVTDPETGAERPRGEIGMIEVRGPNVFKGYWQMPEKTRDELRADGFFITGDLGQIDERGYVTIVGRAKDLIISGGYNIYPKEIELALDAQPGVKESAVIGVPHADFGEAVVAVLVPEAGAALDTGAIAAALRESLAGFKLPRRFEIAEALPRNTMGKVQKTVLRARFADSFA